MSGDDRIQPAPRPGNSGNVPEDQPARRRGDEFDEEPQVRRRRDADAPDMTGGIIPYKNPAALAAYYMGVFSLIPGLGCLLAPLAIILGIVGVIKAQSHPNSKGMMHGIAGVVLGLIVAPAVWFGIYFLFTHV